MRIFLTAVVIVSLAVVWPVILQAGDTSAAALYKTKCVMCHGADGTGNTPMGKKIGLKNLRTADVQGQTDAQLLEIIENGRGKMPGQKGRIDKGDIRRLVVLIRGFADK